MLFFLPLVFAALFYPLRSFVPVGAIDVLTFVGVGAATRHHRPHLPRLHRRLPGSTAVMCAWQAQNHDRQRERLTEVSRTDPLTGCLNRRGFGERVNAELDEALRARQAGLDRDARPRQLQGRQRRRRPCRRRRAPLLGRRSDQADHPSRRLGRPAGRRRVRGAGARSLGGRCGGDRRPGADSALGADRRHLGNRLLPDRRRRARRSLPPGRRSPLRDEARPRQSRAGTAGAS